MSNKDDRPIIEVQVEFDQVSSRVEPEETPKEPSYFSSWVTRNSGQPVKFEYGSVKIG